MRAAKGAPVVRFRVRVQPRASRSAVVGTHGDAIKVQIAAPPVDGAANAALIALLADALGVPRAAVRIAHGDRGRDKRIEVTAADPAALERRLGALVRGGDSPPSAAPAARRR